MNEAPEAAAVEAVAPEAPEAVDQVEASEAEAPEAVEGRAALSWDEAVRRVPPDIANLMRSMQGDYTRKTQELAAQRKDVLREREALQRGASKIQAPEELGEFDPFNESSVSARIEAEVARRLQDMLAPMQQEYELMAAEDAYQGFLSKHPDFESDSTLRAEVQKALETSPSLDLETAYYSCKVDELARKQASRRHARRPNELRVGKLRTAVPASRARGYVHVSRLPAT